ncbi:MAG: gamma carbonic anhydrase family protein [Deltaproteobacteria bacterium]|nr:gamma carbonic anhydrase family protein [Deltaproteobacteria bacterium]
MALILPYKGISPRIHPTVFTVETAQIIGDVEIGEDSSVWFNAVVRGDVNYITIGRRTNVQDNSVFHVTHDTHPLVIGDDVTIGHSVTLHGCTVKGRSLIGMGAVILDGAVVEEDTVIGAGALVTENMVVPSGSLVLGVPGKVRRELTSEERGELLQSARNYIEYSNSYREGENV